MEKAIEKAIEKAMEKSVKKKIRKTSENTLKRHYRNTMEKLEKSEKHQRNTIKY